MDPLSVAYACHLACKLPLKFPVIFMELLMGKQNPPMIKMVVSLPAMHLERTLGDL